MFETIGVPELLIILAIVMLLFGAGKVSRLGKDLGTSVKEFRRAMSDESEEGTQAPGPTGSSTVELPPAATQSFSASAESQPQPQPRIF